MVEVIFYQDSRNRLSSIFARGHAEFADADDVVCAAVSAILQAARLGLEEHAGIALSRRGSARASFSIRWPERDRDDARVPGPSRQPPN